MKLHIKYDIHLACKIILQEHLDKLGVNYEINGLSEIEIKEDISPIQYNELQLGIKKYGIEIIDNDKAVFVQKIKDIIVEMVYLENELPNVNISVYISEKLGYNYIYLSNIFSEVTYSSIGNFIILQKIERAKKLIIEDKITLTEVAWKLNYSSLAHLSNQFKKTTGITPTAFQRIIKKRKEAAYQTPINIED